MGKFKHIRSIPNNCRLLGLRLIVFLEKYQDRIAILVGLICVLFLASLFASCSCNYHLRKAANKCPNLRIQDTITVHDTLRLPEVSHDTTFYSQPGDTVYVTKDRLKYRYINLGNNQHSITAKCDTVFVPRVIKVPYVKTVYKFDGWLFIRKNINKILWSLILIVLIITGIRYFILTK